METDEELLESLEGDIVSVIYTNDENGYAVVEVETPEGARVTVVGTIPYPGEGETVYAEGTFLFHPTFGQQFKCETVDRVLPAEANAIIRYLSSGTIKGIGPSTARKMVEKFGTSVFDVIRDTPERLTEIKGMTPGRAKSISAELSSKFAVRELMAFFAAYGLELFTAVAVYKKYGAASREVITQDPYILAMEPFAADFGRVDRLAHELGFGPEDYCRVSAGIIYELMFNQNEGHVYIPFERLVAATVQFLGVEEELVRSVLEQLSAGDRIETCNIGGERVCYLARLFDNECFVAQRLAFLSSMKTSSPRGAAAAVKEIEENQGIAFSERQRSAILASVSEMCLVLTGGPGTGKTTAVRGMVELLTRMGSRVALAAPTGRAAKRMSELTGKEAKTIHRLLEVIYTADGMAFSRNVKNPLEADAVIVDETSMVDVSLMASLMAAMKSGARLILVGDPDQLPSVGPGTVLSDIVKSGIVPCVHLEEIFRQARESDIVMNAHAVNRGEIPRMSGNKKDFFFLNRRGDDVVETVTSLCAERLPKNMGFDISDIQVITPSRQNANGVLALNPVLRDILNPPAPNKKERSWGGVVFREGDRVMQVRNNYDIIWKGTDGGVGVFNGDMGYIKSINTAAETVTVEFPDKTCDYDFNSLGELEHAYAITVHKAQGSEFRAVVFVASLQRSRLLNRNLFYTAMTRARELFVIVGSPESVAAMVNNKQKLRRYSGLLVRLKALLDGVEPC
ncbi:MAG: ATP-dependent RecD-like DNA helicase [Ruminococcaceae bacterium]|nr:ATP-dependent RecD-like DNA helicase [Oscillospiraceae bacterium]